MMPNFCLISLAIPGSVCGIKSGTAERVDARQPTLSEAALPAMPETTVATSFPFRKDRHRTNRRGVSNRVGRTNTHSGRQRNARTGFVNAPFPSKKVVQNSRAQRKTCEPAPMPGLSHLSIGTALPAAVAELHTVESVAHCPKSGATSALTTRCSCSHS